MEYVLTDRFPIVVPPGHEGASKRFKGRALCLAPPPAVRSLLLRRDFHVGLLVAAMDLVAATAMKVRTD